MHHRNVAGWMAGVLLGGMAMAQPVQWRVEDGGNGHWYEAVSLQPAEQSWHVARSLAASRGADLVTISNAEENAFVRGVLNARTLHNFFIGAFATGSPCATASWKWVDPTPWSFSAWDAAYGQPDCNDEQCVTMYANGLWHNYGFAAQVPGALIEWSADCNNDGLVDFGQIRSGDLVDADNNGIPDGIVIATQPVDQTVGVDGLVTFFVEVETPAGCATPVTFQWQRRNPAVADPAAPAAWIDLSDGGGFLGTRAANLLIARPTPGLATGFRCRIGGNCGCEPTPGPFIYTDTVTFSVACPADFNADGGVDFGDVEEFFTRWENGC